MQCGVRGKLTCIALTAQASSPEPATPKPPRAQEEEEDEEGEAEDGKEQEVRALTLGSANEAARGLRAALGLFNESVFGDRIKRGLAAIEHEWRAGEASCSAVGACIRRVLHPSTSGHVWPSRLKLWRAEAPRVTQEHRDNFRYVRYGTACAPEHLPEHVKACIAKGEYHGGKLGEGKFDCGHDGMTLESFHQ
eukprot:2631745-Rhodomonas_salina.1